MRFFFLALAAAFLAACTLTTTDHSVADFVANPLPEAEALSFVTGALRGGQANGIAFDRYQGGDTCPTTPYSDLSVYLYDVDGDYVVYVADVFNSLNCYNWYFGTAAESEGLAHSLLSLGAKPSRANYTPSGQVR